jgi:putative NADPH-quinone reductase
MSTTIVAILGSYRKGGTIETAVESILDGARARGAQTQVYNLREQHIEFCTNCRSCMQAPGTARGHCVQKDDLENILTAAEAADTLVLASPVNCYNTTALYRRFMERLVGFGYWPWGQNAPSARSSKRPRRAVLVSSAAMPGFLIPLATGAPRALRLTAALLGAKVVARLWIGLAAHQPQAHLSAAVLKRAQRIGALLV